MQRLLVGGQVTLSTVLAAGACLLAVSFFNLISQPLGFAPEGLLTFRVQLGQREYPDLASKATLHRDLREALRALPGVEAAGTTSARPLGTIVVGPIEIRGGDYGGEQPWAGIQAVDPSYFGAARIPLAAGRPFDARDAAGEPAVIINERLARSYFAAEEPLGRLVKLGPAESEAPWLRVVGVVGDVKHAGLAWEYLPEIFVPYGSLEGPVDALLHNDIFVTLRAAQRPAEATLRRTVAALDPDLPITEILTGEDIVALSAQSARFQANVMTAVALLAVILAGVGLYGVVAQSVAQRRKELAIRMALGASAPRVFWTACRQASALAASGTVCGVAVTYALARSVQALLFQVDADDPRILLGVASVMLLLAAAAMVLPGLRAATAQPAAVVRGE